MVTLGVQRLSVVSVVAVVCFAAAACGASENAQGPTAKEAGVSLRSDIAKLLDDIQANGVKVVDPGKKNISCGDDRARQTYGVSMINSDPADRGDMLGQVVGLLETNGNYKVADANRFSGSVRNRSKHTLIKFKSKSKRFVINGQTDCLSAG